MERKPQHLAAREANAKLKRTAWLATTALTVILFHPGQLLAQPALSPTTTPQGGVVVAGSSTIAQNAGSTTITQTSSSTVINWQSFNIGGKAQVTFAQPSSSAIALNRVVTATPSIIAGKINANGQIVLVNQSGVVFTKGSQVNAESIVVSTSNISNADFMAGHLVFSGAPNPGAKIVNNGTLTAREAGLVGLVAPQVANNGVITAQLGQVVLAGASAFTLDLYGDRLISLDVTQAVRAVDVGGKTVPALVTNRGLILADGGKITLTAQDADALVTQLIDAGGTIRANTVGSQTGTVTIQGVGGNIQIAGNLLAQGTQSGSKGGAIEALTTGTVSVAAGAVIDASGNAGGGVVALGTDLQRATTGAADTTAPRAAAVDVASTVVVKANATGNGNGGKITLLSSQETDFSGTISTQGGTLGGNGGTVEISSDGVINLSGTVFDTALDGQAGEILLDPATLVIGTGTPAAATTGTTTIGGFSNSGTSYIDPASLSSLAGTIVLEADTLITVSSAVNLTSASALSLVSDGDVEVGASISLTGSLEIDAAGTLVINAGLNAGNITLTDNSSGTTGIAIAAPITAGTLVALQSGGGIAESSGGLISAPTLTSTGINNGNDLLNGANTVSDLGSFSVAPGGLLDFVDTGTLILTGPVSAPSATISASTIGVMGDVSVSGVLMLEAGVGGITEQGDGIITAGTLTSGGTTIGGDVSLANANTIATLGGFTLSGTHALTLVDTGLLTVQGTVKAGAATLAAATLNLEAPLSITNTLALEAGVGGITELPGGRITAGTLTSGTTTIGGDVALGNANTIATLGDFALSGTDALNLVDTGLLTVGGTVTAGAATLAAATLNLAAPLSITNALALEAGVGGITELPGGMITAGTLTSGGTTIWGDVALGNANTIATLGDFALSGTNALNLVDTGLLTVAGTVTAGAATLAAATLNLAAPLSITNALALEAGTGGITELPGGMITAGTLTSGGTTIGGDVALGNANTIATLGDFALSGTDALNLVDTGLLTVGGTVTAGAATLAAATLNLAAPLSITNALALEAGVGGITELPGGMITAGTLTSGGTTIGGDVALGNANTIATLGDFALSGTHALTLVDTGLLTVAGTVTAGAATLDAATLTLDAPLSITNALALEASSGGITEDASGSITAGTLSSGGTTIGGDVSLASTANSIGTLGVFAASGNILLDDTTALNIAGLVATPDALTLEDSGAVTEQTGGTISAATLSSGGTTIGGDVSLASTANSIGALADFILSGTHALTLVDSGVLDVAGTVTAGAATLDAAGLTLDAPLSITNTLMLEAGGGGITEGNGGITAGTLSSGGTTIGGDVSLASTANSIGTLEGFILSGTHALTLVDSGALDVAGTVTAGAATLDAATLTLDAPLSITNTLVLEAGSGGITEGTGGITAGTLSSGGTTIGGAVSLSNTNTIGALGAFAASGNILLENTGTLNIAGLVATPDALTLEDSGAVTELTGQNGGTISAATLSSGGTTIGGDVSLAGTANSIAALADFILSGTHALTLVDSGALDVAGTVAAGAATLDAATLTLNAPLSITGALTLEAGSGGITEGNGGGIRAGTLSSGGTTIGGDVSLASTANSIGTLGAFAASGNILLDNATALNISGLVATPDTLTLEDRGAITELSGQNGGTISAATLSSGGTTIGGDVSLASTANSIGTLADFILSGTHALTLVDSGALDVAGTVTAGAATLDAATLTLDAPLSITNALALEASSGGITEGNGGGITAGTLSSGGTTIGGDVSLASTANSIGTLGVFAASGNILLENTGTLNISGLVTTPDTLTLEDSGAVTEQTGGTISAATLSSGGTAIGGDVSLTGTANSIGALADFILSGTHALTLVDSGALDVAGMVTAGAATLDAAGLTLDAPLSITNALVLEASAGGITEDASGSITAGTLSSGGTTIGGDVSLASTANSIGALADFVLSGTHALTLVDSGALDVAGTVTAGAATLAAATLNLAAPLSITNALTLEAGSGGITEGNGGSITAGTLSSGGTTIGGDASLASTANSIGTLGAFAASGNILLNDATALDISGLVTTPDALTLEDSGAVTELTGGTINAATLSSGGTTIGGDVSLTGTANSIGALADFVLSGTHALTLVDSGALDVAGTVTAGAATLDATTLTLDAPLSITNALTLEAGSGGITEGNGGGIRAGTLSSGGTTIGGDASLASTANSIGTLGAFAASGNILLDDADALNIAGLVTTPGMLTLEDNGAVTELVDGALNVGTLSSGGTAIGGDVSLASTANGIGALADFILSGTHALTLVDSGALDVTGTVTAGAATLDAATLTLDAPLSITNALALEASSGGITEGNGGGITAGTLSSGGTTIGGDVSLTSTANSIATLENFAVGTSYAFDLNDTGSLVVAGRVTAASVTLSAGAIAVQNEISASGALSLVSTSGIDVTGTADAGTLALQAGGNVSDTGGTIVTGMLTTGAGSISGNAVLTGSNTVAQLGSFTVEGNLSLANTGSLLVAAQVQASTVWLADQGTVTLGAPATATAGQVTLAVNGLLAGGGSIGATGGTISITPYTSGMAVDLGGTAAGGLELSSLLVSELDPNAAVISITTTGSMFTEGTLAFSNPDLMLAARGPITQTGTLSGDVIDLSGSSLTLYGMLTATSLNLASPGGVTQSASGVLAVGTLSSGTTTIGGAVALDGTANAITTLGAFTAAQNFTLDDGAALTVNGPLSAANITLTDGSPTASSIALDGTLAAGTGGRIDLVANRLTADGASLLAPGGTVAITPYSTGTAIDLGGTAAGLDLSSALLAAVGSTTSLLNISTTGSIAAEGAVTVTAGTLSLSGNGIAFNGVLDLPGDGVLQVASTNGITTEAGETLTASTLRAGGAIIGPVNMAAGTNNIGTLGAMAVSGTDNTLALRDATTLDVTGSISAGNISLNAAGLTIANTIAATTAVTLNSSNGIAETGGGLIDAPSLSSGGAAITGLTDLAGANTIATLTGFLTSGNLLLNDTSALTLAGTVGGANITLAADGLNFGGTVNTPGLLALSSAAGISQQSGTIGAALLTSIGTIGGAVDLTAAGNAIQTLGAFAATSNFTLEDGTALTLNGPLNAANVTLGAAGLALDGAVSTGVLQLSSSAGVDEGAGGQVNAALLTTGNTGVTGDAVLNNAGNQVAALGNFAASGGLTLNDAAALSLTGPVTLGGTLALLDPNGITQTGGGISAAALTSDGGTIGGNAVFTSGANDIPVLGNFAATGDVSIADAGPLSLQGNINAGGALNLNANGAISQNGGIIFAPLLNAAAPSITLTDANNIAALGNVSASGDVDINGVSSLLGQLTANNATLSAPGDFTLSGGAEINDALDIIAAGNVDQTAGTVNAQNATISAADITLSGTTAIADQLDLAASGNITHEAGVLSAGTLVGSAGQLASFAATTDFGTLGSFIMQDSLFSLKNAGALIITGPVVANAISITAAGMVTLLGSTEGGLFITGSIAPDQTTRPRPGDSVITVTPGANGAAPEIAQTGTFLINAGPNAASYLGTASQPATLFLNTTPNGTINFANYPDGLYAPSVDLILSAGGQGTISGNVNLQHIEITSALSTELTGTIDNVVGPTAAGNGSAAPFPQPNFRFNTCPIGSVNCTILPIETLPSGNPLENFDISSRKHKQLYRNVQLPGIATRDF